MSKKTKSFTDYASSAINFTIDDAPIFLAFMALVVVLLPCWLPIALIMWILKIPLKSSKPK